MSRADHTVEALHRGHDQLAEVVAGLAPEQLKAPSACADWPLHQVLSHLGSGAEITLAGLEAALAGRPNPGADAAQQVWDRWNAMTPEQHAAQVMVADRALLDRYDAIDDAARDALRVDLGFLPAPLDLDMAARFRLSEFTYHSWDVRVTGDPRAELAADAVPLLLDVTAMMFGFLARVEALDAAPLDVLVRLTDTGAELGMHLEEGASAIGEPPAAADATLELTGEAWLRLTAGRLAPDHTPGSVAASGSLSLDTLRAVFPGY